MNLSPWQSFRLQVPGKPAEVIRDLAESIPPCSRWRTDSYFCGTVNIAARRFALYRSGLPKFRLLTPVLRGTLTPGDPGTNLEISVAPSFGSCLFLLFPLVIALPMLLLLILQHSVQILLWFLLGVSWIGFASCLWGPALLTHYLSLPRFRAELMRLVSSKGEGGNEKLAGSDFGPKQSLNPTGDRPAS